MFDIDLGPCGGVVCPKPKTFQLKVGSIIKIISTLGGCCLDRVMCDITERCDVPVCDADKYPKIIDPYGCCPKYECGKFC